jgi:hypothetical protein
LTHQRASYWLGCFFHARDSGFLALLRLCSLLGVAIELLEFPLSFSVAIRRMGSFVLVVLAHSMQSPFYGGRSRSAGL